MANTYTLIEARTVASATHSVTLSTIPQNYTDLLVRFSLRSDFNFNFHEGQFTFNSVSSDYSQTLFSSDGSNPSTVANSSQGIATWSLVINGSASTSNTFSNGELYIPNYSSTTVGKSWTTTAVTENNATAAGLWMVAGSNTSTAAISSLTFYAWQSFINFVPGSTFYLYGIKNS